jgi:hypothetical protein
VLYLFCEIILLRGGKGVFHQDKFELVIVQNKKRFNEMLNILMKAKYLFFDTETSGLRVRYPGEVYVAGFTFAVEDELDDRVWYVPIAHTYEGKYTHHIDMAAMKLNPKDFSFDEKKWIGKSFYNMDARYVTRKLKKVFDVNRKVDVKKGSKCLVTEGNYMDVPKLQPVRIAHNISYDAHVCDNSGYDGDGILENGAGIYARSCRIA